MLQGFKKFIVRGNVLELAVGVVIGAAFNTVVQSFVKDLLTPFLGLIGGNAKVSGIQFTVGHAVFNIGDFFNAVLSFVINATVIYFFVVAPLNKLRSALEKTPEPSKKNCPFCFTDISLKATRCPNCTSQLEKK